MGSTTLWWQGSEAVLTPPFAHLNLTHNPFGELPLALRGQLAVLDVDVVPYLERLTRPGFALQILGECGRGKTTRLLALREHLPTAPYLHLPEGGPCPHVPRARVLFLDETQRFSRWQRRQLWRRPASFVIGTHQDHRAEFERAGLQHETLELRGLSPEQLSAILARRIEAARRGPGEVPTLEAASVQQLIDRFGDDVRRVEGYLYEVFQRLRTPGPVRLR